MDEEGAVDEADAFESRAALGLDPASPLLLAAVGADDSGTAMLDPFPEPLDALAPSIAGAEGAATEPPSVWLLLPFEVVLCAAFSELALACRAARRFPSAIAAWPSDWPELPFGVRTHSKLMVYTQVV